MTAHDHQTELMQALGFTERDLAANQRGRLSNAQRWRFYAIEFAKESAWIAAVVVIAVIWQLLNPTPEDRTVANVAYVMPLIFMGIILVFRIAMRAVDIYTLRQNPVEAINGLASKEMRVDWDSGGRNQEWFYLQVGPQRLEVRRRGYFVIQADRMYTVYFRPTNHRLLSIEAFDG